MTRRLAIAIVCLCVSVSLCAQQIVPYSSNVQLPAFVLASGSNTVTVSGIAATSTDGFTLQNAAAADGSTTVQMSPRLRWRGAAWDTAASETVDFFIENLPVTAATPTGILKFGYSLNGGAASYPLQLTSAGALSTTSNITSGLGLFATTTSRIGSTTLGSIAWTTDGIFNVQNNGQTIGSRIKVDATPTVGSGFGTSPSVTTGSTPFAGQVNVGTGGVATSGVITFGGTAFPSAPFCTCTSQTTNAAQRCTATTTQVTIASTTAWTASDLISWMCVSPRS